MSDSIEFVSPLRQSIAASGEIVSASEQSIDPSGSKTSQNMVSKGLNNDSYRHIGRQGGVNFLTVIGESLIDRIQLDNGAGSPLITDHVGGSPLNVAIGCARLGLQNRLITHLGADKYGEMINRHLDDNQVEVLTGGEAATSMATATIGSDGSASYTFSLNWDIGAVSLPTVASIESSTHLHTGSIATMLMPGARTVYTLVQDARKRATISFDPNCRPTIITNVKYAREQTEKFIKLSDVVKASDEDLKWLYPNLSLHEVMDNWLILGPALVIVTRGEIGPIALTRTSRVEIPSRTITVADTIGAGDSFMSALITALGQLDFLGPTNRPKLQAISREDVIDILEYAVYASSLTCSRAGANPPTLDEIGLVACRTR